MGSTGKKKTSFYPPSVVSTLPKTVAEAVDRISGWIGKINPHYKENHGSTVNCQRCVIAAELAERGESFEAFVKRPGDKRTGFDKAFNFDPDDFDSYYVGASDRGKLSAYPKASYGQHGKRYGWGYDNPNKITSAKDIVKAMEKWGNGSRAVMHVFWKGRSSSHVVNVKNVNGTVIVYDGQSGRVYSSLREYLSTHAVSPRKTCLFRTDHLQRTLTDEELAAQRIVRRIK